MPEVCNKNTQNAYIKQLTMNIHSVPTCEIRLLNSKRHVINFKQFVGVRTPRKFNHPGGKYIFFVRNTTKVLLSQLPYRNHLMTCNMQ